MNSLFFPTKIFEARSVSCRSIRCKTFLHGALLVLCLLMRFEHRLLICSSKGLFAENALVGRPVFLYLGEYVRSARLFCGFLLRAAHFPFRADSAAAGPPVSSRVPCRVSTRGPAGSLRVESRRLNPSRAPSQAAAAVGLGLGLRPHPSRARRRIGGSRRGPEVRVTVPA